jgi:tRNA A-37 threonylcarbamoyl transferase component Bud32
MTMQDNSSTLSLLSGYAEELIAASDGQGYLTKIEVGKNSEVRFEMNFDDRLRWFEWNKDTATEIVIALDKKIPLAGSLNRDGDEADPRILSYRPHRRLTLLDRSGSKPRVIKGFRAATLDKMIEQYEKAHQAFSGTGVNAPHLIEYDFERSSLIMMYEDGEPLSLSADAPDVFYQAGEALRMFQEADAEDVEQGFSASDELAVIDKRAGRLLGISVNLPEGWKDLRERIEVASQTLPPACIRLAHRDLHDKQFICHKKTMTLIDFDLMCAADDTLDAANFLAHLVLRNLQGVRGATQQSIDICGKQFLQGLDRFEDPGFWERLRFYQATTFCRLALIYELRPRWSTLVPALVTMGNRCLDDLARIQRFK